ncbi:MAG: hypothetical protein K8F91_21190, partial [Candidatus Obscuribacterales bacterium]|nr:hypothetical protein [Candidatus Obscuribacterales bacterium]
MFGFSESEYKWCPQCAGNIRKQANYCRFCKKAINNKLLKDPVVPAVFAIDAVSQWLPDFNSLTDKISLDLKGRFEKADIDTPAPTIGVPSHIDPIEYRQQNRESEVCPPEPPEAHVAGLIYDILLSIFSGGENLTEICQHPRLKLLEVTPQEVVAEYELRKQEIDKGYQCD